jgi:phosphoglycolate phosphatase
MRTLIFDFDGTIADSFETLLEIFEEITARPKKLTDQEIGRLRGESLKDIIKYLKIKRWQLPRIILKAKRQVALKMPGIKTFPGMTMALKALNKDGCSMYILSTNSSENIGIFLKKNSLDGLFLHVYGDIGLRSKSSALKKIIKAEKLNPKDCVYIGDEVRDIEAAKKAKITSVGVTWGFNNRSSIESARPDFSASSPASLAKYLTS